jgi:ribonuclease P protein subunit RPR2
MESRCACAQATNAHQTIHSVISGIFQHRRDRNLIMAKKDKDPAPNPASIPNKDIIQRLNFLYQASVYLSNLSRDVPPIVPHPASSALSAREEDQAHSKVKNPKSQHAKQSRRRSRTTDELSRAYVHTMTMVGKRATVKMCVNVSNVELDADLIIYPPCAPKTQRRDPSIKRTLCKSCKSVLVPGVNVIIRVKRECPLPTHLRLPVYLLYLIRITRW